MVQSEAQVIVGTRVGGAVLPQAPPKAQVAGEWVILPVCSIKQRIKQHTCVQYRCSTPAIIGQHKAQCVVTVWVACNHCMCQVESYTLEQTSKLTIASQLVKVHFQSMYSHQPSVARTCPAIVGAFLLEYMVRPLDNVRLNLDLPADADALLTNWEPYLPRLLQSEAGNTETQYHQQHTMKVVGSMRVFDALASPLAIEQVAQ